MLWVQGLVPAPAQKLVPFALQKLLIQLFIFSSRYCFKECFFLAFSPEPFSEPSASVVLFNTPGILPRGVGFPQTDVYPHGSLNCCPLELSLSHGLPPYPVLPTNFR